jgi:hypothetical protein
MTTWLPWTLLAIVTAMLVVESWVGRRWYRIAMEWRAESIEWENQRDALAAELAVWKRTRGQS